VVKAGGNRNIDGFVGGHRIIPRKNANGVALTIVGRHDAAKAAGYHPVPILDKKFTEA
jgi:hypothetical protein